MIKENDIAAGNYFIDKNGRIVEITGIEPDEINNDTRVYYTSHRGDKAYWLGFETFKRLDIKPLWIKRAKKSN